MLPRHETRAEGLTARADLLSSSPLPGKGDKGDGVRVDTYVSRPQIIPLNSGAVLTLTLLDLACVAAL